MKIELDKIRFGKIGVIILAAGRSTRMEGIDKITAPILGRSLLNYSLDLFESISFFEKITVVASLNTIEDVNQLIQGNGYTKAQVVVGGERRQDSVRLGLQALGDTEITLVHDAARPCITEDLVCKALQIAKENGTAVPVIPVSDTVKEINDDGTVKKTLIRDKLFRSQTPQAFLTGLLTRAHKEVISDVTDDASMLEMMGHPVNTFKGDEENIKVTTRLDLAIAESILKNRVI